MATVKTGYSKYDSFVAFAPESTFGTAIADDQNFTKFDILGQDAPSFNPQQFVDEDMRNRALNVGDISDRFQTENGQFQTYQIPEFIAPADVLAKMVYAALQGVSEAAGDPFVKTFTINGSNSPDFSSNAGYFFTLLIKSPLASFSQKLTSCVLQDLTIRLSPDNGGRITASGTAITGKGYTGTSNPSGTNSYSTVGVPNFHDATAATFALNSLDLVWRSMEIQIQNQWAWLGYSSGNAENYKLLRQRVLFNAVVKYDSNSDVFLNSKGADVNAFALTIGANSADPYFYVESENTWLSDVTVERGDDNTVQNLNLSGELLLNAGATEYPSIEIADGVDQTW